MKLLGLTGSIACGKSTIVKWLVEDSAVVLDADKLVHELYRDPEFAHQIGHTFGNFVLDSEGTVNRAELGRLVFGNPHKMVKLEEVVHPAVTALRDKRLQEIEASDKAPQVVVLDAVKLVESGQYKICDAVWCVVTDRQTQLQRLMEARGLSHREALQRIVVQPPSQKKDVNSSIPITYIENNGTVEQLKERVTPLWQAFKGEL